MRSLVDLEVFASRKNLATVLEWTGKRLFTCVNPNVIDELVFGLEGLSVSAAFLPKAGVICALWPANVVNGDVGDNFLHGCKLFQTRRAQFELLARLGGQQGVGVDRRLLVLLLNLLLLLARDH